MKIQAARPSVPWFLLPALAALFAALPGGARAASSFVDGLPNFQAVDSAVDSDGVTYVLGVRNTTDAILRRYDSSGAPKTWVTNGTDTTSLVYERVLAFGAAPASLFVAPGTNGIFIAGGTKLTRLKKTTGAAEATLTAPASVSFNDVAVRGNLAYACGTFASDVNATVFGQTARARGSKAAIAMCFNALFTSSANATALVTFGFSGPDGGRDDTATSIVVDDSGDVYVAGHLSSGGAFGADFGLTGKWAVTTYQSGSEVENLSDVANVLAGANIGTTFHDTIDFTDGGFPQGNRDDFVIRATGLFRVPAPGSDYVFFNHTDDGSWLKIDGVQVIYDNSRHGAEDRTNRVFLSPGLHSIEFVMFDGGGPGRADFDYQRMDGVGVRTSATAAGGGDGNRGYVYKLGSDLTSFKSLHYTTDTGAGLGGELLELHYAEGWVYALGFWKGIAHTGLPDPSNSSGEDIEVLRLDTDLVLKGRATGKGMAHNRGLSLASDEEGNVYFTGTFGAGSLDLVGSGDRDLVSADDDRAYASISSSRPSLFVAKLDRNMNYQWVRTPRVAPQSFSAAARVRWNQANQKLFWTGSFTDGPLTMGEPETEMTLNTSQGFLAAFDPDGKFTQRVKLTVYSEFGEGGTQVLPFGGPQQTGGPTAQNTRDLIKGVETTVAAPRFLYRDLAGANITIQNEDDEEAAQTRVRNTGYSVDGNVPVGEATSYRFILDRDTTVEFNWTVEHALTIDSDFTGTVGLGGILTNGMTSKAAGTPVPTVNKHWIQENENVIATVDSELIDLLNPGQAVKYLVTGYNAFGPVNPTPNATGTNFIALPGTDLRRQVGPVALSGPAKVTWVWELRVGIQVNTTGPRSATLPRIHVLKDFPGQTGAPQQTDGFGVGTFFFKERTVLQILSESHRGMQELKGWFNGDGTLVPASGLAAALTPFTVGTTNYKGFAVPDLVRAGRVMWDYGDRIFEEIVNIGNPVSFTNVDDAMIRATLVTNSPPVQIDAVEVPQGTTAPDMAIWDDTGKRFYPLRPGIVLSYWRTTSTDTNERVIVRIISRFPASPHYNHIASTPGVNLDPEPDDLVSFRELKYTENGTTAQVDDQARFTATGPGRTVLLFKETSAAGQGGAQETLRVRVVQTRLWNDQLPGALRAPIGTRITSPYDTAGLDTGFVFFEKARYNPFIHDRESIEGPIIPVNLHPTALENEQLVVVWYERRDRMLWPYQPVRYEPDWPTEAEGLNRIVIASRFGSECVAQAGTNQIITPEVMVGTNLIPAEVTFNPARFQQVTIYNQPVATNAGYNPNEEHALMAPSLRYAAVSPRPSAAYALRDNDLNLTTRDATYTSDPYVLVEYLDLLDEEFKMKVFTVQRTAENLSVGDLSYRYAFQQSMEAGEPVIPFYPLPFVIGATPCPGDYGKEGNSNRRVYWKDHKGTAWAVSGNGSFSAYFMYPLLVDFWWPGSPASISRNPGDCVPFLPNVPAGVTDRATIFADYRGPSLFKNVNYTRNDQTPAAQAISYSTVWPENLPVLKVGETMTFSGGEYRADNPISFIPTPDGDIELEDTPGLPSVVGFAAGEIVYDDLNPAMLPERMTTHYTVRLFQALEQRVVNLPFNELPASLAPAGGRVRVKDGKYFFNELSASLQKRVFYDPISGQLGIKGFLNEKDIANPTLTASPGAVYALEPNIFTMAEWDALSNLEAGSGPWTAAVASLYRLTRNPNGVDMNADGVADPDYYVGIQGQQVRISAQQPLTPARLASYGGLQQAITTLGYPSGSRAVQQGNSYFLVNLPAPLQALGPGLAANANPDFLDPLNTTLPDESYVMIAENNHDVLGSAPITLHLIKVIRRERYRGAIKTLLSDNVFDENIVLRHTGDFGGNADNLVFEWWYRPEDGTDALTPDVQPSPSPWKLFGDPSGQQGRGFFQLTLKGNPSAPEALLADTLFFVRYRHRNDPHNGIDWRTPAPGIPYQWAGAGNSSPRDGDGDGLPDYKAQLAQGWVKRVLLGINPYEARIRDFSGNNPATYVNMLRQLGQRFEGAVALNPDQNVIENVGLIELYETVFNRARALSIDLSTPISTPAIANALQLASTRLADFYMLLGNEAYTDAVNPTIGYGGELGDDLSGAFPGFGLLVPSVFSFQNQVSSLLEEELALLRGQDDDKARPVYNRLFWNFTGAEGEAAYALNYNVFDLNTDGFINEQDGAILYPQGHGDAWGHYLSSVGYAYDLLTHPYFNWVSRSESINLQDIVIDVDYLDERKFAQAAAAKAKVGTEIVNMTYREKYVSDPAGQWQGYVDTDKNRAWGFEEWARRAGQGAYFDWITANALLPAHHPNTNKAGIEKVDRTTVEDIKVISANLVAIQTKVDEANSGNNPVGVANGGITFDVDPTFLEVGSTAQIGSRAVQGLFHFDQIFERALTALKNAKAAFDHANQVQNRLRQVAINEEEFRNQAIQEDLAYRNRLIELFGTPYQGTIGSGKPYPPGYQGPDTMLFMYADVREISDATVPQQSAAYRSNYTHELNSTNALFIRGTTHVTGVENTWLARHAESFTASSNANAIQSVNYTDFSSTNPPPRVPIQNMILPIRAAGYTFQAPTEWGQRSSPGELQGIISQMIQAESDVASAIADWDALQGQIVRILRLLNARYEFNEEVRAQLEDQISTHERLRATELVLKTTAEIFKSLSENIEGASEAAAEAIPKTTPTVGLAFSAGDVLGVVRSVLKVVGLAVVAAGRYVGIGLEAAAGGVEIHRELEALRTALALTEAGQTFEVKEHLTELENTVGGEAQKRIEIFKQLQVLREVGDQYRAKLAEGSRLIEERTVFNRRAAALVQRRRYQDMSFRQARNAALEKYRSAFDLAARYTYIAANTYDYETNLDPNDPGSPVDIIDAITRQRTVGILNEDNQPAVGGGGLSESLSILRANYDLLKTRMGFNNPQIEVTTFSLRQEKYRIPNDDAQANATSWKQALSLPATSVPDLWQVPEFRLYCRPFAPATNGPQPGLVIQFSSSIFSRSNFFGWPLGGGDNAYDPSVYSTKIQSVGLYFEGYPTAELSATPRAYLVPVGTDILRVPSSDNLDLRLWNVKEHSIPVPMQSISAHLDDANWKPLTDSLATPFGQIRRFSSFRAYGFTADDLEYLHDQGSSPEEQLNVDTRLIARSVWNTRWMIVIPGATLNADPIHGLKTFIHGPLVNPADNPATGNRTGQGVTDIKLVIRSYGFSGN